jgi:hypothetical protein
VWITWHQDVNLGDDGRLLHGLDEGFDHIVSFEGVLSMARRAFRYFRHTVCLYRGHLEPDLREVVLVSRVCEVAIAAALDCKY